MSDRIQKIKTFLSSQNLDGILISSPSTIAYITTYFGFSENERDAYLLVTKKNIYLFTNPLYETEVRHHVSKINVIVSTATHPFARNLSSILKKESVKTVGFEETNLTVSEFQKIHEKHVSYIPVSLDDIRIQKSSDEIHAIRKACELTDDAFSFIQNTKLNTGTTEKELAIRLELFILEHGARLSFPTIVAFGENSATPHHHTGHTKLKKNDIILIDFGVRSNTYCSDMTRTFFHGEPTREQRKVYDVVLESQKQAVEYLNQELRTKNFVLAKDVDKVARNYITSQGYPTIPHSLGHGIGIEVHEAPSLSPFSDHIIEDGMVFSIEPGVYLPKKFGVRIEDLYEVKNSQLFKLTTSS